MELALEHRELFESIRGPLRLAPAPVIDRLVTFLADPLAIFDMFAHVADGLVLRDYAKERGLPYFAIVALYESSYPAFEAMRKTVSLAVSREDRERVREALRGRSTLSEHRKRFADVSLKLAEVECPLERGGSVKVGVQVNLGQALIAHHRAAQRGILIEADEDLGLGG